jgi:methyl-accepting chemotaxis protein
MTEIGSQAKKNAANAGEANQLALDTRKAAEAGNGRMRAMVSAMAEIQDASRRISNILRLINDIAFQTNILSLNAAVEAARAGRHGRGFGVVATEIRALAERTTKSAQETGALLDESLAKVANGSELSQEAAAELEQIVQRATRVSDLVGEIAAASNEQAEGIQQINRGLEQVDSVTQHNTANAEETATAAQELLHQSRQLERLLKRFTLRGGEPQAAPRVARQSQSFLALSDSQENPPVDPAGAAKDDEKPQASAPARDGKPPADDADALNDSEFGRYT